MSDLFSIVISLLSELKQNPELVAGFMVAILIAAILVALLVYLLIKKIDALAITTVPNEVEKKILATLPGVGVDILRKTLIEAIIKDVMQCESGKGHHHKRVLELLKALHSIDERLLPGIEVIAEKEIGNIISKLKYLQSDNDQFMVIGKDQVAISEAFAAQANSVIFIETALYKDIDKNWTHIFMRYLGNLKGKNEIQKRLYILWEVSTAKEYILTDDFKTLARKMRNDGGFEVFLVPLGMFNKKETENFKKWRFEIFNNEVILKVPHLPHYDEEQEFNITLRTLDDDAEGGRIFAECGSDLPVSGQL